MVRDIRWVLKRNCRALVVAEWSACSPTTPTIRVLIPLTPKYYSLIFDFEKKEHEQKRNEQQWAILLYAKTQFDLASVKSNSISRSEARRVQFFQRQ